MNMSIESMMTVLVLKNGERIVDTRDVDTNVRGGIFLTLATIGDEQAAGCDVRDVRSITVFIGLDIVTYNTPNDVAEVLGREA